MNKVLVVDDDLDILTLVKTILTVNKFVPETLSRWEPIYSVIETFKPNLILIDISLSGADGTEICKVLKQNPETMAIPVILFSANVEMAKRALDCGAQDYLSKPFSIKELIDTIQKNIAN
jgi:DNA-binding response OmpR family regulator